MTGVVKTFDGEKGYGFIVPEGKAPREADVFFHATQCGGIIPEPGDAVTFEMGEGRNGKPAAVEVRLA